MSIIARLSRPALDRLSPPVFVDSHAHLDRYDDAAVAAMLARARAARVRRVVAVSSGMVSARRTVLLARRYPGRVVAAAGIHPANAGGLDLDALRRLIAENRRVVRAVGEIGLDRTGSAAAPLRNQMVAFDLQLRLAAELGLPVIVHAAGAHRQAAMALAAFQGRLPAILIHYFTGSAEHLAAYLRLDCYISFGRLLLQPAHTALRALVPSVPAERLLGETDSYPLEGRTTEPKDIVPLVALLAGLRGEPIRATAALTARNLERALSLPPLPTTWQRARYRLRRLTRR